MVLLLLTSFNVFPFPQKQLKLHTVSLSALKIQHCFKRDEAVKQKGPVA